MHKASEGKSVVRNVPTFIGVGGRQPVVREPERLLWKKAIGLQEGRSLILAKIDIDISQLSGLINVTVMAKRAILNTLFSLVVDISANHFFLQRRLQLPFA